MANVGLLQGMSAVIPTDDFWRQQEYVLRQQQMGVAQKQADKQRAEAFMKAVNVAPTDVHGSIFPQYQKDFQQDAANIYQLSKQANGQMTRELYDAVNNQKLKAIRYKRVSDGFRAVEQIPDQNLDPTGQWLKKQIRSEIPYDKIEEKYNSEFGGTQPPLKLNENGVPDMTAYFIPDPNYLKPIEDESDKNQIFRLGSNLDIAGRKAQVKEVYSPRTKKEAEDFMKQYGEQGIVSTQEIAFNRLGDETVYRSAYVANRDEFNKRYDAALAQLNPDAQQMIEENPDLKKKLSREILSEIVTDKITKKPKYDFFFEQKVPNTNVNVNTGEKEQGTYTKWGRNIASGAPLKVATNVEQSVPANSSPRVKANAALNGYAKGIGVSSGNFMEYPDSNVVQYNIDVTPEKNTSFEKLKTQASNIFVESHGKQVPLRKYLIEHGVKDGELEAYDKLFNGGVYGSLQHENIYLKRPNGTGLTFGEVVNNRSLLKEATPYLRHVFNVNLEKYKNDKASSDEENLLKKMANLKLVSTYNMKTAPLAQFDASLAEKDKSYVQEGAQGQQPVNVNVSVPVYKGIDAEGNVIFE